MAETVTAHRELPTGTVTFLRTDVEGSMALARRLGARWDELNIRHLSLIRHAVEGNDGRVVRTEGDAVFAVFGEAGAAVAAAVAAQAALTGEAWPPDVEVRVRMGLHSGEAHLAGDDYGGFEVNRAARIASAGHGGQIVLSGSTYELTADDLPGGVEARELGTYVLRDVARPERLYQLDVPGLPTEFPELRAGRTMAGNLDPRLTTFLGRERDLARLRELLARTRLVTLTGAGGIGKSSLAVELARTVQEDFPDGAWFVPLDSIEASDAVEPLIARTIGLFDGSSRSAVETLPGFVAERSMLFVLDNFEHVMGAASVVAELVRLSQASRVIVTSRAPLRLTGEQEYPVAPLGLGLGAASEHNPDDAARRLFLDRARATRPGWDPGAEASVVDEICALVDGLPLGIELAAARVALLPPSAIRDRLAAHLPLPGAGARDAPARQRTLDGTVAWSHDLLEPRLQRRLQCLSVFEGGFDAEQAGVVTYDAVGPDADVLDDLAELSEWSLVVPMSEAGSRPRFRMLQTIQSFALGRLIAAGHEAEVRRRHADAYLELIVLAEGHLSTFGHATWLDRVHPEIANLRVAVRWVIEAGEADLALRLVAHLWRFWHAEGLLVEGGTLVEAALAMPDAPASGSVRAWAVAAAGNIAYWRSDSVAARGYYEEQVRLAKAAGDEACLADAYFNLGHVAFIDRDDEAAQMDYVEEVLSRYRGLGDERGVARAAWAKGVMAMGAGRIDEAEAHMKHGVEEFTRLGDAQYLAMSQASLGWVAYARGDIEGATRWTVRSLLATYGMRDIGTTTISLHVGVLLGAMSGREEDGAVIAGAFDALCERYGVRPPAALDRFIDAQDPFAMIRAALEPEVYDAAYQRGQRMSLDEAVAMVASLGEEIAPSQV